MKNILTFLFLGFSTGASLQPKKLEFWKIPHNNGIYKVVMIITAELSRAQSAHSGPPWVRKFGYAKGDNLKKNLSKKL